MRMRVHHLVVAPGTEKAVGRALSPTTVRLTRAVVRVRHPVGCGSRHQPSSQHGSADAVPRRRAVPRCRVLPGDRHVHSEWSWDAADGSMERTCARAMAIGVPAVAFTEHVDHDRWPVSPELLEGQEHLLPY